MICKDSPFTWAVALAFAILTWAALFTRPKESMASNTPPFVLGSIECERLDENELTRILDLELSSVDNVDELPALVIDITCDKSNVIVSVTDPDKTQKIERSVPEPENIEEGRERQLALIIAQFAGALWRLRVEELAPKEPSESTQPKEEEPKEPPEQGELDIAIPHQDSSRDESSRLFLEAGSGLRARAIGLTKLLMTGYGEISMAYPIKERFRLVFDLGLEGAGTERLGGKVGAFAVTGGVGISGLLMLGRQFHFDGRLLLLGGYARFEGRADDPEIYADHVSSGGVGEVRIELVPTLVIDRVAMGLCLQGGYGLEVVTAQVREDEDVTFGGWFIGVGIRISYGADI